MIKKIILVSMISAYSFAQNITWLEEAPKRMNWEAAVEYCKKRDARLPSKKFFKKLWLENNKNADIKGFDLSVSYWTSTLEKGNDLAAYPFYFGEGREDWYYKADHYGVRCIK